MKVLLAYEHYPCSIGRFWKRGLIAAGHEVHSVGHCTGGKVGWGEQYDLSHWIDRPDYQIANFSNRYQVCGLTEQIAAEYDLFVNVDAAHWWQGQTPCPKVIIGTDPHCIDYDGQRKDADLFVCMQKCYSKPGDVWLPYAYDAAWHYHLDIGRSHDVTFWGVFYRERADDLEALQQAGITVVKGTGRVFDECVADYCTGDLAYCRPSRNDLPARFFEAMAYGCIPLTTYVPDLALFPEFQPGWHYEVFDGTRGDLIQAARRALSDPALAQRKADAMAAVKPHTWQNRAEQLIALCRERWPLP